MKGDGVRKKGKRSWTVRISGHPEVAVSATTRAEAKRQRAKMVAKLLDQKNGVWDGDANVTLQEVWDRAAPLWRTLADFKSIDSRWRRHLQPAFGAKMLRQITRNDLRLFLKKKEAGGLSPQSCEHLRVRMGALFVFAAEEGIYRGENVAAAIGPVEVPEASINYLDAKWLQPLIDTVPGWLRNFFAMALFTGMRSGELRALKAGDIDPDWRGIEVTRSGSRDRTKTGKPRFVPLPKAALPYLKDALQASRGRPWLFVDAEGKQLSRDLKLPNIMREAMDKLGLISAYTGWCHRGCKTRQRGIAPRPAEGWRCPKCKRLGKVNPEHDLVFHDLRKTFGTYLYELTGDLDAVRRILGHGSDRVTRQIYVAASARRLGALADRLDFRTLPQSGPSPTLGLTDSGLESVGVYRSSLEKIGGDSK